LETYWTRELALGRSRSTASEFAGRFAYENVIAFALALVIETVGARGAGATGATHVEPFHVLPETQSAVTATVVSMVPLWESSSQLAPFAISTAREE
jgi:hypothetical protein